MIGRKRDSTDDIMPVRQNAKAPSALIDTPWSTARVQVWRHKWVVVIIRVYAPIAVDAYALDADDLAVFRAQTSAAIATEDTSLLAVCLRSRPLQGAPLRSRAALCSATARLVPRVVKTEVSSVWAVYYRQIRKSEQRPPLHLWTADLVPQPRTPLCYKAIQYDSAK